MLARGLTCNGVASGKSICCYQAGMNLRQFSPKRSLTVAVAAVDSCSDRQIPTSALLAVWGHMICHSELVSLALILA